MSIIKNEDGEEIEVITPEERDAAIAAEKASAATAIAEKEAEIERLKKVSAEKTENFRKYNDMTEEERKAHSENEIIQIRRADQLADELEGLKKVLTEKEVRERDAAKSAAIAAFHNGKDDVKKSVEDNYAILAGMPETTPEEIRARAAAAARLSGIVVNSVNPLYQTYSGEAPQYREKNDYTETGDGKIAADMMREALGLKAK